MWSNNGSDKFDNKMVNTGKLLFMIFQNGIQKLLFLVESVIAKKSGVTLSLSF